ncbi:MAG: glutamate synthase, partial [Polyangiales bacterium]
MGKPRGFLEIRRSKADTRPVDERLGDWREVDLPQSEATSHDQAARCMDCGIPFCHSGCPLGNLIPEWNDLVFQGRMHEASVALHATNNFPEVTGRVCPAPCEASCVLAIDVVDPATGVASSAPVTIKNLERTIADHAVASSLTPKPATRRAGRSVAVVG